MSVLSLLGGLFVAVSVPTAVAAPCDPPVVNPVACENTKPGNPASEWDISGAGSSTIQGFTTDISVDKGQTVQFKVDSPASDYRLDIYRMGYYAGMGARRVATVQPSASLPQNQPNCLSQPDVGLLDCGNWAVSASWSVPADAVSGIYFAKLVREDASGSSHVFFVVRDDASTSDLLFQTSDPTWQAYNGYGGQSLYPGSEPRANKVSYNRPFDTRDGTSEDWVFNAEYPAVRFLERNGYDVSYTTGVDTDRRGDLIQQHQVFLSVGHDEYWSGTQRANVEAARDAGVNLAFFSGNEVFWKTRWEPSIDGSAAGHRTLVSYKETHDDAKTDPSSEWTGTWRDPRFSPPSDGGRPENELTGQIFMVNCCTTDMVVTGAYRSLRFWRNTPVASLAQNGSRVLGDGILGYEWDEDVDNGSRPPGLIRMSQTTSSGEILQDYGSSYGNGTATHHLTLYRHAGGALVFGAGSVQWAWGLDDEHDNGASGTSDVAVQQATVNLLADMGVQPSTIQADLSAATQSSDTTAPTSVITSPTSGATPPVGQAITVTGTAADTGGVVAGVEVSTDNGQTWHPAAGTTSWSYSFTPPEAGTRTIRSRATDDSARTEAPSAGVTITVGGGPADTTAPAVTTQVPAPNATGVSIATNVSATFDEPVVTAGLSLTLSGPGGPVPGAQTYDAATRTVTFDPAADLTTSTTFTATLSGAADTAGNAAATTTWTFVTAASAPPQGGCPCSIWPATATPSGSSNDREPVELGVRFRADADGYITGIRYYKASGATGTHLGRLWTNTGSKLAEATFTGESASGWQQVSFANPVAVTANTTYVASYLAPDGVYSQDADYFTAPVTQGPLTALADGADGPNGPYVYGPAGGFPNLAWRSANYWVDVVYETSAEDTTAPTITSRVPAPDATGVSAGTNVSATFNEPVVTAGLTLALSGPAGNVAGTQTYDAASRSVTFDPAAELAASTAYTVTLSGVADTFGNTAATATWSFTTAASAPPPSGCPCTIWPATATPSGSSNDREPIELGVRFRASADGFITGIRYYKPNGGSGTRLGRLWTNTGSKLAEATFTNETASGWQQVSFANPVAVSANTTYVATYFAPDGRYAQEKDYFTAPVTRGPLTALADGTDGPNGPYVYGPGGGFPNLGWRSANYWVDVVYETSAVDQTPPQITSRIPAPDATGVSITTNASATFSEPVVTSGLSLTLSGPAGAVPGAQLYDTATKTVSFDPTADLATSTTYTATLSGVTDPAGNAAPTAAWSFTTAASPPSPDGCPCSVWPSTATPQVSAESDSSAVELGLRFRSSVDGYVTGIRFYKGTGNGGTHVGTLWSNTGTPLSSVTFTGETASGWQEATLPAPVAITANSTYVVSYHAPQGRYAVDGGYFANAPTTNGPLTALQNGADGPNGVYLYGGGGFPTQTFDASNYWVDVVFSSSGTDTSKPTLSSRAPAPGQSGVAISTSVTATFNEPVTQSSIQASITGPGGAVVATVAAYDATARMLTVTPEQPLAYATSYTVDVSGAQDPAGNVMDPASWSFTTGAAPPPPPTEGPGGPIAVVTSATNPFSSYLAEIVRTEGFNEFLTVDVGSLNAAALAGYQVVVLGQVSLTATQVDALTAWVNGGGNLIAMRPTSSLSGLLGLTPATGTLTDGYLKVDSSTSAGAGITTETVQFHGPADRYSASGTSVIATLYNTASAASTNPAVTLRPVGTNGGQAAAFTYDLARSVVLTRQGNPAWSGLERDGDSDGVIRSDDMFVPGGGQPGWVDMNKVAIPQADEQQRLLANLIEQMSLEQMPLPRFWYFPGDEKAAVVATGDDHANGGTAERFNIYAGNSPTGCNVADWECLRFTSFVYPGTPITDSQALSFQNQGFEIGLHPQNGCSNFTAQSLPTTYTEALVAWSAAFPSLDAPVSNRFHCLVWSDWGSQFEVEHANGMRLDTNYYYWPGSWIQDRPGFMTGSGLPMRFARQDGTMVDVFQATTQMTDESGQSYPFTPDRLLDNALGTLGYYGYFTANMHTDQGETTEDQELVQSARSRGVPIISAEQLLSWLDARNASSFTDLAWDGDSLQFGIAVGTGGNRLTAMLPTAGPDGRVLTSVTRNGTAVTLRTETVKGIEYAHFPATAGSYSASYTVSAAAPLVSATSTAVAADGEVTVTWSTDEPATSELSYGTAPADLDTTVLVGGSTGEHELVLDELDPGKTYYYRVSSTDPTGRRTVSPATTQPPRRIVVPETDKAAPKVRDISVLALPDGTAEVSWRTDEASDSTVLFGPNRVSLDRKAYDDDLVLDHVVLLNGLEPDTAYTVQVVSRDATGNSSAAAIDRFTTPLPGVADHTVAAFGAGDPTGRVIVGEDDFGSLTLQPRDGGTGTFVSRVLDAHAMVDWQQAEWTGDVPAGATLRVSVRTGSTATPDDTWTSWQQLAQSGDLVGSQSRYLQYRIEMTAPDAAHRPVIEAIGFIHGTALPEHDDREANADTPGGLQ